MITMIHGFTVENWRLKLFKHPVEDSYSIDSKNKILAVSDGVTRDPAEHLSKLKVVLQYPNPSPAKISADIFTQTFPLVLKDYNENNKEEKAIRSAFEEANKRIGKWNNQNMQNPDYVTRDFAGCVASGTLGKNELIYWGYLTDCGVAIFEDNGNLRFRTENQGPDKHDEYIWKDERLRKIGWVNPEARRIVRRDYRNNPSELHSFGVLTGEETAMHYVRTGTNELKPNEYLIVYTDGLESTIFSNDFSDALRKKDVRKLEKLCRKKVRTEGTLIYSNR